MAPCVAGVGGAQKHFPLQLTSTVTCAEMSAPESQAHSEMYMLPACEVDPLGQSRQGWLVGPHWPAAHDDRGGGGGGGGGGGVAGHAYWLPCVHQIAVKPTSRTSPSEENRTSR